MAHLTRFLPLTALLLAACQQPVPVALTALTGGTSTVTKLDAQASAAFADRQLREASGPARVGGLAVGPVGVIGANIVASNAGRVIGQNGGSLISNNGTGIVASNAGRYALLDVKQKPIVNAIVYLTDPDERFYAVNGQPLVAATSEAGRYDFVAGVPTGEVVIVNVILADNRREVGFTVSKAGKNAVDVSLATTYVTEFLRDRAARLNKTMGKFDLSQLTKLTKLTEQALAAGDLPVPDLAIGQIAAMNQGYALAVGLNKQGLGDAWTKLLGARVLAVTTVAGSGESGLGGNGKLAVHAQLYKPKSVTADGAGNLYIADEGNHMVRKIDKDGIISTLAGVGMPQYGGDGGPAGEAGLWWPRIVVANGGSLYVGDTLNMRIRRVDLVGGKITTVAGNPEQANGAFLNDFAGDGGPAAIARLAGVRGGAFDGRGGFVFADSWDNDGGSWHHIRRIDPSTGVITSIVGVDGRHGYEGDGKPGRETAINYVNQVAIDGQDNVFFADARNHRIRRWDAKTTVVTTVAGDGSDGTNGDGGLALNAQLSSPYGLAVDRDGRLFIAERGSRRLRMVGRDGKIHTLAGGGTFTGDGEARSLAFTEPHDLCLEGDGNLLFCDSRAAKVRRLWLKWGM